MKSRRRPADESRLLQLVYYGYVAGSWIAARMPEGVAYGLAGALGRIAMTRSGKREVVARNLARITGLPSDSPAVRSLVGAAFTSYARYWLETFRLVRKDAAFFLDRFRATGEENLDAVMKEYGKGAIVVVGHLGNWDAAGAWVGATGRRLVSVVEELKPRRMFEFFADHRASLGMTIYPARAGITAKLVEEVENGAVLAIVGDRDLKGRGVKVSFFGEDATFPAGAASIALRTGVPVMVAGVFAETFEDGKHGWRAIIEPPLQLPEDRSGGLQKLTQEVADSLERFVAMRPEEWHVFQPFWLADRERKARS
ncbi:MAG: phosphatidylinositol mannoside acyltransferase [Actinobacteria bacterium]|nr:phosphatidylinositol mannoside acyltransferase [Actinomycetota bacterium]